MEIQNVSPFREAEPNPEPLGALPRVPGLLGQRALLLEFTVLALYWLVPALYPAWNYAGLWSEIGYVLFFLFFATVGVFVLWPLHSHLKRALTTPQNRLVFHGLWVGALALGLFATSTIRLAISSSGPSSNPWQVQWDTVYTPFGAWPGVSFYYGPAQLYVAINAVVLGLLGLVAVLWASSLVLGFRRSRSACDSGLPQGRSRSSRVASIAVWGPIGFISACSSCLPTYAGLLALVAPGAVAGGYEALPIVPWIGLAGLLYLISLGLTLVALHGFTRPLDGWSPKTEQGRWSPC